MGRKPAIVVACDVHQHHSAPLSRSWYFGSVVPSAKLLWLPEHAPIAEVKNLVRALQDG
jgi:hypothetical protein